MTLSVTETFFSIQGEGTLAGVPSVFVRLAGCHLRCHWCDTTHAWTTGSGQHMTVTEILRQLETWTCDYLVITGGEPLLQDEVVELTQSARDQGYHITIETAAPRFLPVECDLMSISPKLASAAAGPLPALNINAIRQFIDAYPFQLKFVVGNESDLPDILALLQQLHISGPESVLLMPQARRRQEYLVLAPLVAEICLRHEFRFCPRLHIELWDNEKGR